MTKFNWKKSLAALFAAVLMVGFTACDQLGDITDSPADDVESISVNYNSDTYFVMDAADEILDFQAGDMQLEFSLKCDSYSMVMNDRDDKGGHGDKGGRDDRGKKDNDFRHSRKGIFLGSLLKDLKLDATQMTSVKALMIDYFKCRWEVFQSTQEDRREIMEWANEQRKLLIEKYRADETGEYTKEQLRADLIALNVEVKAKMLEIFDQEAYCACLETLLQGIDDLFEEGSEQQAAYDAWYALLEGPCFDTATDPVG